MKSLRLKERFKILRDRLYFHVILKEELDRIDGKLLLLLDHQLDIRTMKPAVGDLRLKQEACFQMLRLLKRIAESESIPFWLDFGTLLGAVRHGGFVPWDDDLDISLANPEYDRFCSILPEKLPPQLFFERYRTTSGYDIGISRVVERKTGFYIDIYPYDRIPGALRADGSATEWLREYRREFEAVFKLGEEHDLTKSLGERISGWLTAHGRGDGTEDGIAVSMWYFRARPMYRRVYSAADVFPLKKKVFEGEEFFVPYDSDRVLSDIYGDVMRFPKDAGSYAQHGRGNALPEEIRAVIDELNGIVRTMDKA